MGNYSSGKHHSGWYSQHKLAIHFFFFGTTTSFANHFGYPTSLINLAANNFSTSTWMTFCLFGWKCQTFWRTGGEEGIILSRCEAIDGWILGIRMSPCEDVFIMLKYFFESFCFLHCKERANIGETIIFLWEMYDLQGVGHRRISFRRAL